MQRVGDPHGIIFGNVFISWSLGRCLFVLSTSLGWIEPSRAMLDSQIKRLLLCGQTVPLLHSGSDRRSCKKRAPRTTFAKRLHGGWPVALGVALKACSGVATGDSGMVSTAGAAMPV